MQNEKALRSQKRDLKKSNCKSKKDKGGILDLIFKKEPKRYTVEDTIPYLRLLKSGICQLDEKHFSKSIAFQAVSYTHLYSHCISFIFTWHRNSNTLPVDDVLHIWSNSIFFTKRGYHRDRSIDIRIFVKPIRNTNGWNSCYSRFNGSERSNTLYLENDIYI